MKIGEVNGRDAVICEWFALCDHDATKYRPHPVLGEVPICDRCDERIESYE